MLFRREISALCVPQEQQTLANSSVEQRLGGHGAPTLPCIFGKAISIAVFGKVSQQEVLEENARAKHNPWSICQ